MQALRRLVRRRPRRLEVIQDGRAHLRRHHSQPKVDQGKTFYAPKAVGRISELVRYVCTYYMYYRSRLHLQDVSQEMERN